MGSVNPQDLKILGRLELLTLTQNTTVWWNLLWGEVWARRTRGPRTWLLRLESPDQLHPVVRNADARNAEAQIY